jgi:hypothetical protein
MQHELSTFILLHTIKLHAIWITSPCALGLNTLVQALPAHCQSDMSRTWHSPLQFACSPPEWS